MPEPTRFDRLAAAVKEAVKRARIDWDAAAPEKPTVQVNLDDWTRIVSIATPDDEPGPTQLSGPR